MSVNCSELVAHSSSDVLWKCIDHCGQLNETSSCFCRCLVKYEDNRQNHPYFIMWLYCAIALFLVLMALMPCNEYWRRRRSRRNYVHTSPVVTSNTNTSNFFVDPLNYSPLTINKDPYYSLPSYQQAALQPPSYSPTTA